MKNKKKEIQYLKAKYYYYIGNPIMTDAEFDELESELKQINSPVVKIVDFPTEKQIESLGFKISDIIPKLDRDETKYKHPTLMLSLEKVQVNDEDNFPENEIVNFMKRNPSNNEGFECTLKYDGNAIECLYQDGKLKQILTRGNDGETGLDKTEKLKYIVPNEISNKEYLQIRGELLIDKELWEDKYYDPQPEKISNPRNWLAGIVNRDELNINTIKDLVFVAYDLVSIKDNGDFEYFDNTMKELDKLGFNQVYQPKITTIYNYEDFKDMYFEMKKYKEESNYLIDGIVIKYPEKYRKKMGYTSHHPKHSIAIKFPSEEVVTKITDITWSLGRNKELTPVAILEPVELLGTIVRKASLSNLGNMMRIGGFPGAKVSLKKSGEIIPMITNVIEKSTDHDKYIEQINEFMKN